MTPKANRDSWSPSPGLNLPMAMAASCYSLRTMIPLIQTTNMRLKIFSTLRVLRESGPLAQRPAAPTFGKTLHVANALAERRDALFS